MPIHDWTQVDAGIFHHFHHRWITAISDALNGGVLPENYYALAEQITGDVGPDVVALKTTDQNKESAAPAGNGFVGTMALVEAPPRVRVTAEAEQDAYVRKQNAVVIYHASDDEVVALVEILSAGNKAKTRSYRALLDKALAALEQEINLLMIDLYPPTKRDPHGFHGALWSEISEESYQAPRNKPLTLGAYVAGQPIRAFVEPFAVGDVLPDMPLFLDPGHYVPAPLEKTYQEAWRGVPKRWQTVLET